MNQNNILINREKESEPVIQISLNSEAAVNREREIIHKPNVNQYIGQQNGNQQQMFESRVINEQIPQRLVKKEEGGNENGNGNRNGNEKKAQYSNQFGNYQKMRQSIAFVQQQQFTSLNKVQQQVESVIDNLNVVVEQMKQTLLPSESEINRKINDYSEISQTIQSAKLQAISEIEDYFDDLQFMVQRNQPTEELKQILLVKMNKKINEMQCFKEQIQETDYNKSVQLFNMRNYTGFFQDCKNKLEEIQYIVKNPQDYQENRVKLVINEAVHQKMRILLPEFAYIKQVGEDVEELFDSDAQDLNINIKNYFETDNHHEIVLVTLNDHYQTLTLYNPILNQQRAMKLSQIQYEIPYQHSVIVTPEFSYIYICGGMLLSTGEITDTMYQFDIPNIMLSARQKMNVKKIGHSLCYMDGEIYSIGGKTNDKVCTKLCEKYNIQTNTWTNISSLHYGRSRCGLSTFITKDNIKFIYAFFGSDSLQIINNTIERYILATNKWEHINIQFPFKRLETSGLGCCQINTDEIIIFGGFYEEKFNSESATMTVFSNKIGIFNVKNQLVQMSRMELPVDYNNTNSCQAIVQNNVVYTVGHFMQQKSPQMIRCLDVDYVLSISKDKSEILAVLDEIDIAEK